MRVNVYAEEMTDVIEIIKKEIDGHTFTGLRFYLYLPVTMPNGEHHQGPFIHRPGDDDSSAVTFWGKRDLRKVLRKALTMLDEHYGYFHTELEAEKIRNITSAIIEGLQTDGASHKQWALEQALKLLVPNEFDDCRESWQWKRGIPS